MVSSRGGWYLIRMYARARTVIALFLTLCLSLNQAQAFVVGPSKSELSTQSIWEVQAMSSRTIWSNVLRQYFQKANSSWLVRLYSDMVAACQVMFGSPLARLERSTIVFEQRTFRSRDELGKALEQHLRFVRAAHATLKDFEERQFKALNTRFATVWLAKKQALVPGRLNEEQSSHLLWNDHTAGLTEWDSLDTWRKLRDAGFLERPTQEHINHHPVICDAILALRRMQWTGVQARGPDRIDCPVPEHLIAATRSAMEEAAQSTDISVGLVESGEPIIVLRLAGHVTFREAKAHWDRFLQSLQSTAVSAEKILAQASSGWREWRVDPALYFMHGRSGLVDPIDIIWQTLLENEETINRRMPQGSEKMVPFDPQDVIIQVVGAAAATPRDMPVDWNSLRDSRGRVVLELALVLPNHAYFIDDTPESGVYPGPEDAYLSRAIADRLQDAGIQAVVHARWTSPSWMIGGSQGETWEQASAVWRVDNRYFGDDEAIGLLRGAREQEREVLFAWSLTSYGILYHRAYELVYPRNSGPLSDQDQEDRLIEAVHRLLDLSRLRGDLRASDALLALLKDITRDQASARSQFATIAGYLRQAQPLYSMEKVDSVVAAYLQHQHPDGWLQRLASIDPFQNPDFERWVMQVLSQNSRDRDLARQEFNQSPADTQNQLLQRIVLRLRHEDFRLVRVIAVLGACAAIQSVYHLACEFMTSADALHRSMGAQIARVFNAQEVYTAHGFYDLIVRLFDDPIPHVRMSVAHAAGQFGNSCTEFRHRLVLSLEDSKTSVRESAAAAFSVMKAHGQFNVLQEIEIRVNAGDANRRSTLPRVLRGCGVGLLWSDPGIRLLRAGIEDVAARPQILALIDHLGLYVRYYPNRVWSMFDFQRLGEKHLPPQVQNKLNETIDHGMNQLRQLEEATALDPHHQESLRRARQKLDLVSGFAADQWRFFWEPEGLDTFQAMVRIAAGWKMLNLCVREFQIKNLVQTLLPSVWELGHSSDDVERLLLDELTHWLNLVPLIMERLNRLPFAVDGFGSGVHIYLGREETRVVQSNPNMELNQLAYSLEQIANHMPSEILGFFPKGFSLPYGIYVDLTPAEFAAATESGSFGIAEVRPAVRQLIQRLVIPNQSWTYTLMHPEHVRVWINAELRGPDAGVPVPRLEVGPLGLARGFNREYIADIFGWIRTILLLSEDELRRHINAVDQLFLQEGLPILAVLPDPLVLQKAVLGLTEDDFNRAHETVRRGVIGYLQSA